MMNISQASRGYKRRNEFCPVAVIALKAFTSDPLQVKTTSLYNFACQYHPASRMDHHGLMYDDAVVNLWRF